MATYDEAALTQKLAKLVDTQDSITVLAQWLMYHRKHAASSVRTWARELHKASPSRKLCFLYLANDVVQNSRRKGDEFVKEFAKVFPETLPHVFRHTPPETQQKIGRILAILEQRHIYPPEFVQSIKDNLGKRTVTVSTSAASLPQRSAPSPNIQPGNKITGDVAAIAKYLDEIKQLDIAKAQQSQAMNIRVPDDADDMSSIIEALSQYRITLADDISKRTSLIKVLQELQERMHMFVQGDQLALDKCNERIASLNAKQQNTESIHSSPGLVSTQQPHTFQMPSTALTLAQVPPQSASPTVPSHVNQSVNNNTPPWPSSADAPLQPAIDNQQRTPPGLADQEPPPPLAESSPLSQVLHDSILSPAYPQPFAVPQSSDAEPWPSITDPAELQTHPALPYSPISLPDPSSVSATPGPFVVEPEVLAQFLNAP
ncbi:RNA polymerase II-binding domain-containing protein [Geranomyces variabilis]|nr:RNA polymerase II-binding domain-containing protein [Geranomyces variabilis]KAJ3132117.1 Regulation of nuclear pre-mRNA domain-containing protein 1A [Geranomyces variabilis]